MILNERVVDSNDPTEKSTKVTDSQQSTGEAKNQVAMLDQVSPIDVDVDSDGYETPMPSPRQQSPKDLQQIAAISILKQSAQSGGTITTITSTQTTTMTVGREERSGPQTVAANEEITTTSMSQFSASLLINGAADSFNPTGTGNYLNQIN